MTTLAAPLDVRVMNLTATLLFVACALFAVATGAWWALRHPAFSIARIVVQGELAHNNAVTLRANVAPQISGNFFTVNLRQVRRAFEQVPWVRSAQVQREFPRTLNVRLMEHHAVAHWGPESGAAMVNSDGEVFESNGADTDLDDLLRLSGPPGSSVQVLAMARELTPVFEPLGLELTGLTLSVRGGWRATLDGEAVVELGGGTPAEVKARTHQFTQTLTSVATQFGRRTDALESADLRHTGGYALRLRGVTTVAAQPAPRVVR
ncbi:MAG: cell division protein FtsQ/DivIB [Giesbergeria sp.]